LDLRQINLLARRAARTPNAFGIAARPAIASEGAVIQHLTTFRGMMENHSRKVNPNTNNTLGKRRKHVD
jgi:hypothetical protein